MLIEIYLFFVFVTAAFLQTVTGFGYALVTAPLLALVLDIKDTVMLTMLTGFISTLFLLQEVKGQGSYSDVLPLISSSLVGALFGAYAMVLISSEWLKLFIGVVVMLSACSMFMKYELPIKHNKLTEGIIGTINGFLGTTTSVNGPLLVLYYLNSSENKAVFRGILTRYFLVVSLPMIAMAYFAGTLHIEALWLYTIEAIPALYLGTLLGEKLFRYIKAETFRKIALIVVFVGSIMIIGSGASKLFLI